MAAWSRGVALFAIAVTLMLIVVVALLRKNRSPAVAPFNLPQRRVLHAASGGYIGSESCAECHPDEAESYEKTGMAHSIAKLGEEPHRGFPNTKVTLETGFPFAYEVALSGGAPVVTERGLDAAGKALYTQTERVHYAIGSGAHAVTFLLQREGGYLFEAPLTWYRSLQTFAMSPGYTRVNHRRFSREILDDCLFCHSGRAQHHSGTRNRYDARHPFAEAAIGCERCHGPGEPHAELHFSGTAIKPGSDTTMVRFAKLDFARANDVCLQCHRNGHRGFEVLRPGRSWHDFRPGMAFEDFVQTFKESTLEGDSASLGVHFGGKLEQLSASPCFQKSAARLHCLSCHTIHRPLEPAQRVENHRQVCLSCHQSPACKLAEPARRRQQPDDSCVACHMPVGIPSDVPYTTITDHRIRRPDPRSQSGQAVVGTSRGKGHAVVSTGLVAISQVADPREAKRNLGLAYANRGGETGQIEYHRRAVELLEQTQREFANDLEHRLTHGLSLASLGQYRAAIPVLQQALQLDNRLEAAHNVLATISLRTGEPKLARQHLEASMAINPFRAEILAALAQLESQEGNLERAGQLYRKLQEIHRGSAEAAAGLSQLSRQSPRPR